MKRLAALFIPLVLTALGATALSALTKLPFWASFAIVALALFANGLMLSVEDELPGGFNNPGPTSTPTHVPSIGLGVRIFCAIAALLCIIVFVAWTLS